MFLNRWTISKGRYEIVQGRPAPIQLIRGFSGFCVVLFAFNVMIISLMPLVTVIVGAFTKSRGPVMYWRQWIFYNVERVFSTASTPLINSLMFASIATIISVLFSAIVNYWVVKKPSMIKRCIDYITTIPLALSGTVLGIGLVTSFNGGWLPLTGTSNYYCFGLCYTSYAIWYA